MPSNDMHTESSAFFERGAYGFAAAVALAVLALYIPSLPTAITGEDAGELAAAAYVLGIPHPPGYPLWCLLAHPFTWLPVYTVSWRVSLFSAVMAAATVFLLVLLLQRLTRSRLAAMAGAAALAVLPEFFSQATVPEVYTLNTFFVALCWLLLMLWQDSRRDKLLFAFAAAYGFSLANHNTMLLLGPVFGLFIFSVERPGLARFRTYAGMAVLSLVIAFALYAYLPLRSLSNPPVDWGNPETLSLWWRHVTRGQYAFMLTQEPRGLARLGMQLWMSLPSSSGGWGLLMMGLLGFLGVRPVSRVWLLLGSGLLTYLGFVLIQNPSNTIEWRVVMRVFELPLQLSLAVGLGVICMRLKQKQQAVLAACLIIALLYMSWDRIQHRGGDLVEAYARQSLECLPENAIVVPQADHQAFPLHYLQVVEGLRPDVTIARKYGYLDVQELGLEHGTPFPSRRDEPALFDQLLAATDRPVYFFKVPKLARSWQECGMTWGSGGECPDGCGGDFAALESAPAWVFEDYTSAVIFLERRMREAERALALGEIDKAQRLVEDALSVYGRDATSLYNTGVFWARYGQYDRARAAFLCALTHDAAHAPSLEAVARLDRMTAG
jgi:tetratricopeptide (TPR) repeat protein